ncbi:hypothetical protein [Flavobacterium sp. ACN6]|uniref:hypothetical protein n=1 Tax=Flavobacterium sp. ACN6 TaxID=1920426 RepID=UPI000BB3C6CF|nr:hypothetical protein [Flavobacterium sp. ACN6]PBJ08022.1 hypothetical protein BSF42_37390 [Flavobacterium sp. ACN6]
MAKVDTPDADDSSDKFKEQHNDLVFSYLTLRNLIGFSGLLLPVVLSVFPRRPSDYYGFEPSISDYYYTDRGDILVVVLCVLGTLLITYKGYDWKEQLLTFTAGICGMGVAFVPTVKDCLECKYSVHTGTGGVFDFISGRWQHFVLAAVFLCCLAVMSLVFFVKKDEKIPIRSADGSLTQKGKRNIVFKICGWVIIACLLIMGIYFIAEWKFEKFPFVFIFESIAVIAFGVSWITKGQTLLPDGEHYIIKGLHKIKGVL